MKCIGKSYFIACALIIQHFLEQILIFTEVYIDKTDKYQFRLVFQMSRNTFPLKRCMGRIILIFELCLIIHFLGEYFPFCAGSFAKWIEWFKKPGSDFFGL